MAWTLATPISASSTLGAPITTSAADTTGTIAFVAFVANYSAASQCAVTDSKSNTWTARTAFVGADPRIRCYYCIPSSVGSGHTFTADSGDTSYPTIVVLPITAGADTSTFFDKDTGKTATGAVQPDTSITPTNDGALVLTALSYETVGSATVDSGFDTPTIVAYVPLNSFALGVSRLIQTTKTATQPTWTQSGALAMTVAVFNAGSSGSAFTIDASAGAYAVTGSADGSRVAVSMNAASGSYAITGDVFGFENDYVLNAVAGVYDVLGFFVPTPAQAYSINAAAGSLAVTGTATGPIAWRLALASAAYRINPGAAYLQGPNDPPFASTSSGTTRMMLTGVGN